MTSGWAQLVLDASDTAGFLEKWGDGRRGRAARSHQLHDHGPARAGSRQCAQVMAMVDSDDPDTMIDRLQPLAEIAPMLRSGAS